MFFLISILFWIIYFYTSCVDHGVHVRLFVDLGFVSVEMEVLLDSRVEPKLILHTSGSFAQFSTELWVDSVASFMLIEYDVGANLGVHLQSNID